MFSNLIEQQRNIQSSEFITCIGITQSCTIHKQLGSHKTKKNEWLVNGIDSNIMLL